MKVSMKMISEATGFSTATVSNALNYKPGVNRQTAEKVFEAARRLGYFAENKVHKIKFVIYKRNGLIVEDTPFFQIMTAGAESECRSNGMEMMLCNLDRRDTNFDEQLRWIQNDKSAAVILLGTEMTDDDTDLIRGLSVPFIVIDYWKSDMAYNSLLINNADAARMATEYLIHKGHQEIGYLRGDYRICPFRNRSSGYRSALRRANVLLREEFIFTLRTTIEGACEDMNRILDVGTKLPTAFFADNDMIALGAMKAMTDHGIRIPEDISIIGFDDLPFSAVSAPPLTTLRVPKQEMGKVAVRRIMEILKSGEELCMKQQVLPVFIERESVRAR